MRQHLHLDPERKEMLALKECHVPKYFFLILFGRLFMLWIHTLE